MFSLPWFKSELPKDKTHKVFTTFSCAGGSSFGYKLAGLDVLGNCEIDPQMQAIYKANHNPRLSYLESIVDFNKRKNLPEDLFNLDILDGSPPCSSFSMAGSREKKWGIKKKFREGQTEQVLDDLFFHFIETARMLQPKIVIAENVKGLVTGKAKGYVKQINQLFNHANYDVQLFLLNAAFFGVPQYRERVFFICRRKDLKLSELKITPDKTVVSFESVTADLPENNYKQISPLMESYWNKCKPGESFSKYHPKGSFFGLMKIDKSKPLNTLISGGASNIYHHSFKRPLTNNEWIRGGSFPDDFDCPEKLVKYCIGMSVPPFLTARIALEVKKQWFLKLNN